MSLVCNVIWWCGSCVEEWRREVSSLEWSECSAVFNSAFASSIKYIFCMPEFSVAYLVLHVVPFVVSCTLCTHLTALFRFTMIDQSSKLHDHSSFANFKKIRISKRSMKRYSFLILFLLLSNSITANDNEECPAGEDKDQSCSCSLNRDHTTERLIPTPNPN